MKRAVMAILCVLLVTALLPVPALARGAGGLSFRETPLPEALNALAREEQVNIIVAEDVTGTVTLDVADHDVEQALNTLLVNTPYDWTFHDDVYLVGHRDSALFSTVAETAIFRIQYVPVQVVVEQIQELPVQMAVDHGQALLSVTAPPSILEDVTALVAKIDSKDNLRQVRYHLEIVEITGGRASAIGLTSASLELPTPEDLALAVITDPSVLSMVSAVGLASLQFEAHDEDQRLRRMSSPEIVTALGDTGMLRVFQEESQTVDGTAQRFDSTSGLDVSLTPRHIHGETQEVLTHLVMASPGLAQLDTEVWLGSDGHKLVAVIEQQVDQALSQTLYQSLGKERRYFAVYASAQLLSIAPEQPRAVPSSSLGRLDQLLWPPILPDVSLESDYLGVQVSPGEPWDVNVHGGVWVSDRVRVETDAAVGSEAVRLWAGVEGRIARDDTRVGARVHYQTEHGVRVSLGLSDRLVVSDNVTLGAGIHPIVFGVQEQSFERPYWWIEAKVREDKLGGRVRVERQGSGFRWEIGLDVAIMQTLDASVSYSDVLGSEAGRFWVGLTMRF